MLAASAELLFNSVFIFICFIALLAYIRGFHDRETKWPCTSMTLVFFALLFGMIFIWPEKHFIWETASWQAGPTTILLTQISAQTEVGKVSTAFMNITIPVCPASKGGHGGICGEIVGLSLASEYYPEEKALSKLKLKADAKSTKKADTKSTKSDMTLESRVMAATIMWNIFSIMGTFGAAEPEDVSAMKSAHGMAKKRLVRELAIAKESAASAKNASDVFADMATASTQKFMQVLGPRVKGFLGVAADEGVVPVSHLQLGPSVKNGSRDQKDKRDFFMIDSLERMQGLARITEEPDGESTSQIEQLVSLIPDGARKDISQVLRLDVAALESIEEKYDLKNSNTEYTIKVWPRALRPGSAMLGISNEHKASAASSDEKCRLMLLWNGDARLHRVGGVLFDSTGSSFLPLLLKFKELSRGTLKVLDEASTKLVGKMDKRLTHHLNHALCLDMSSDAQVS